jgi:hypothetical protein
MWNSARHHAAVLSLLEGEAHGIKTALRNFPVMEDESGKRLEFSKDFNVAVLEAIWGEIDKDPEQFIERPEATFDFVLRVREQTFQVDLIVNELKTRDQLSAELPDALIDAFKRASIRPRSWFTPNP